ncbi:MAG TPA: hypothetical protein VD927_02495 [Chryseosolibacter sp.]|nr:hypothetical protein [Chryseosolibacter sp.]
MSTKEKLIEKIQHIDDESILSDIIEMIDLELGIAKEFKLTDEQKISIDKGIKDADEGRLFSSEDVKKTTDQWFEGK